MGVDVVMITGDARQVAEAVAHDLGIDEVFAEVLPEDKDTAVADLQARGRTVAMVGDGVNDAPALARADVGLAIGAGTDVAIESAGVVLASSDPRGVVGVIRLSRASYRKMVQNLAWAAGYNIVAIPLAAGVLAWAGLALSPAVGAILMSASTIVVAAQRPAAAPASTSARARKPTGRQVGARPPGTAGGTGRCGGEPMTVVRATAGAAEQDGRAWPGSRSTPRPAPGAAPGGPRSAGRGRRPRRRRAVR